ncbi:MAG: hypothetical protein K0U29_07215 [Gammaproteobacteria bacterium]|nr:hypothetical protein [Gammaproteobacteria bacterium]MCH9744701.1 hypothetical protein [Gammaproteobacteria bacterium]
MGLLENAHAVYLKWKENNQREQQLHEEKDHLQETNSRINKTKESNPYLILH